MFGLSIVMSPWAVQANKTVIGAVRKMNARLLTVSITVVDDILDSGELVFPCHLSDLLTINAMMITLHGSITANGANDARIESTIPLRK